MRAMACALVLLLLPLNAGAAVRFALAIGNNVGDVDEVALKWAEEDARRLQALLLELGEVATGRAFLLQGANVIGVHAAFARLQGQVEEARRHGLRTEFFVFYSGHGDASSLHLGGQRLALDEFLALVKSVPADTSVTILDACRSQGLPGREKGARRGPAFDINLAREPGPTGTVLITSAGADEIAQESDALRGSFFTHHMLSGLRGGADSDGDGRVTLAEIYRYTYHRTLATSHGKTAAVQHPEMDLDLEGEGELTVSVLERASARLTLPADLRGDVLVVDDHNGRVFAEVHKAAGRSLSLALPAGRFRVQLRRGGRIFAGEVALEWGGKRTLDEKDLNVQPLVAALIKGSDLDPNPFAIRSAALAASPTALGQGTAFGAALGLEMRLSDWPVFALLDLQLGYTKASNEVWSYGHLETRLTAGLGYGLWLGPLRLAASLGFGLLIIDESASRFDGDRVHAVTDASSTFRGRSLGPVLVPGLSLRIPLWASWAASVRAEMPIAFLSEAEDFSTRLGWSAGLGMVYGF